MLQGSMRRKQMSEKTSSSWFWMGVPVNTQRRFARSAKQARETSAVRDLIMCPSSSTMRQNSNEYSGLLLPLLLSV